MFKGSLTLLGLRITIQEDMALIFALSSTGWLNWGSVITDLNRKQLTRNAKIPVPGQSG